jgi:hypothetical protein
MRVRSVIVIEASGAEVGFYFCEKPFKPFVVVIGRGVIIGDGFFLLVPAIS